MVQTASHHLRPRESAPRAPSLSPRSSGLDPIEIIDAGQDRVLVVQDEQGIGRGSGAPFQRRWAVLYTIREAKIVRIKHFSGRHEALEAAGLSE